jgi:hypothetical protein
MIMVYPRTKCHMPSSNASCVMAIRPKAEDNFHMTAMFIVCIAQNTYLPQRNLHIYRRSISMDHFKTTN